MRRAAVRAHELLPLVVRLAAGRPAWGARVGLRDVREELGDGDPQPGSEPGNHPHAWLVAATLDPPYLGDLDTSRRRQLLLGEIGAEPGLPQVLGEDEERVGDSDTSPVSTLEDQGKFALFFVTVSALTLTRGSAIAAFVLTALLTSCGGGGNKDDASPSGLAAELKPLVERAVTRDRDSLPGEILYGDPFSELLEDSQGETRVVDVRAEKRNEGLAVATATVVTTTTVTNDLRGIGRFLEDGQETQVDRRTPIRMSFGVNGEGGWRPGRLEALTAEPAPVESSSESSPARRHAERSVTGLLTWSRETEDEYIADKEANYATGRDSERLANADGPENLVNVSAPPRLGGDRSHTTLGSLTGGNDLDNPEGLLDALLPADDSTVPAPGTECTLDLKRLDAPYPTLVLERLPRGTAPKLDELTDRRRYRGFVDVTAAGYRCPGAGARARNRLSAVVEVARVRGSGGKWKTTLVALGRDAEDEAGELVYEALYESSDLDFDDVE